ncbi:CCA tRNA nucleotidyltransferase [Pseudoclavibacter sp. CFCC 14310]|uniref:CCA tRNA nucleotidyltransferase n=1 Tax=Pseudoclavibacter sp. CFCC 14310 TaxID=2615180 RepID=UPI0013017AFD|nr:CCA tRNA nucleotidyltransferase [Pseudoclavibacter sp. CFCC 14310]
MNENQQAESQQQPKSIVEAMGAMHRVLDSPTLLKLGRAFDKAGFELSLVGGSVRDALLGHQGVDLDFTTSASPDEALAVLKPLATAHWDIGRAFGTVGARIDGQQVEVTTYRADSYDHQTRKPTVEFGDNLEDDLKRRDFTVNAIAVRLPARAVVDPFGGVSDLLAGVLRTPGPAAVSFADDPLRIMRLARFVAQLGFTVDPEAYDAAAERSATITMISAERVRDELVKLMLSDDPISGLRLLVDTGVADHVLPELPALRLETDEHHHHKDVYEHSLTVLRQAMDLEGDQPDLVLRIAALLHDIGKPATRRLEPGGVVTFHNHDLVGARLATKRLKALRFEKDVIKPVARLIELHMRFFGYGEQEWSDAAVRRYVRDAGPLLQRLHCLTRADMTTRNQRKAARLRAAYDELEWRIEYLNEQEELAAVRPELDGQQIMSVLGVEPGPVVGKAYKFLLDLRLDEGPLGLEEATKRLQAWWAEQQG